MILAALRVEGSSRGKGLEAGRPEAALKLPRELPGPIRARARGVDGAGSAHGEERVTGDSASRAQERAEAETMRREGPRAPAPDAPPLPAPTSFGFSVAWVYRGTNLWCGRIPGQSSIIHNEYSLSTHHTLGSLTLSKREFWKQSRGLPKVTCQILP